MMVLRQKHVLRLIQLICSASVHGLGHINVNIFAGGYRSVNADSTQSICSNTFFSYYENGRIASPLLVAHHAMGWTAHRL